MRDWASILQIEKEPKVKDLGIPCVRVAADLKRANVYDDLVQIDTHLFAVTNRRYEAAAKGSDYVPAFFWAPTVNAILRAVYGDVALPVEAAGYPPDELLLAPGKMTYQEIVSHAEKLNLSCSRHLTWAKPAYSILPPIGVSLAVERLHYYFVCAEDESAEIKVWDDERPVVIGFGPYKSKPIMG